MSIRRSLIAWLGLPLAFLAMQGCGAITEQADGAAKLIITDIKPADPFDVAESLTFFGAASIYDVGLDGSPNTGDAGEGNNRYDGPLEVIKTPALSDFVKISLLNEPRLGVKTPIDLEVYQVVFTFRDASGHARSFMPQTKDSVQLRLAPNGTGVLTAMSVPAVNKTRNGGLQDIFWWGDSADRLYGGTSNPNEEIRNVGTWTVYVDVYAQDPENKDVVHTQAITNFYYINPTVIFGMDPP